VQVAVAFFGELIGDLLLQNPCALTQRLDFMIGPSSRCDRRPAARRTGGLSSLDPNRSSR